MIEELHAANSHGDQKPSWAQRIDAKPRESDVAYAAFLVYRDLGPDRSLKEVGRKLGKSKALMERWSVNHDWVVRASHWDAELQRQADEDILSALREMRKQDLAQVLGMRELDWRLVRSYKDKALILISLPATVQESEEGKTVIVPAKPDSFNVGAAIGERAYKIQGHLLAESMLVRQWLDDEIATTPDTGPGLIIDASARVVVIE